MERISIHALREEGDPPTDEKSRRIYIFQSTPSARRATNSFRFTAIPLTISIHALREEGDLPLLASWYLAVQFQSTPSARRATTCNLPCREKALISIHALREESDKRLAAQSLIIPDFNPRPPRGERPGRSGCGQTCHRFQSTPSARRATYETRVGGRHHRISIHALREESDGRAGPKKGEPNIFQSTPSARRATGSATRRGRVIHQFQSTPSARRATAVSVVGVHRSVGISIHALREESDLWA